MAGSGKTSPRLRVLFGDVVALGPGRVDLLDAIGRTGSIAAAAREMGMSYRRAWTLVEAMNRCFKKPLVAAAVGGRGGGGADLTAAGADVVARYRKIEAKASRSVAAELDAFAGLMAEPDGD